MDTSLEVRRARAQDLPALVRLLVQLGYAPDEEWLRTWVTASTPDDRCLVAATGDGVVGLAHVHRVPFLTVGGHRARLTALVVDESVRSQGVGAVLLAAAEQAAREMSADALELSTADHRDGAHRFYERHGYARPSRYYVKPVSGRA